MLFKTEGIVLKSVPFGETSMISTIYTHSFGRQSYMINGVRTAKSKTKNLLQPLTLLELVVYKRENKQIERIKELKALHLYQEIPFDVIKRSIGIFISEVIYKSITESTPDEELYVYLKETLLDLDQQKVTRADFPIRFLLRLSSYLGFAPMPLKPADCTIFDLQNGVFCNQTPYHLHYLTAEVSTLFAKFVQDDLFIPNSKERAHILQIMEQYFQLHVTGFYKLSSPSILKEIL
jgi:DNA repair protein RecO (recombination protein O)